MKILFILENHYPKIGGVETLFKDLTEALSNQGHQITVLTNKGLNDGLSSKESYQTGLTIIRTTLLNRYLFTFFAWVPAIFLARKHDLIHTTSYNAGLPAIIAGLVTRKKTVITFHEVWGKLWYSLPFFGKLSLSLHYLFEQLLLKLPFAKFIAVSDFTANQLHINGIPKSKILRIYNGLNYREFKSIPNDKENNVFEFLFFGRLGISKGLDILIKGAALVDQEFTLKLILPKTPAPFLKTIKEMVDRHGLNNQVNYEHELPFHQLKNRVGSANCVIVPSYSEGFCFSAAETIALGTPIISSDQGALKEVVSGKHLKMESFSPEALAVAMKKAIKGEFDYTEVKKFELEESINAYIELYQKMNL